MKSEELRGFVRGWAKLGLVCLAFCAAVVGFAAESINITATPRYPWNGLVDLKFTIDGTSGTKYDTSFTAKDVAGGTNLTMKTLTKSDGTAANVAKEQLLPGTYNWMWDTTADLGEGVVLEKIVVEGKTEFNEADAKRYMVVDLKSGEVNYMASVPSGGWADNPYKQTKWAFQRIEAGTFTQSSGTSSKRQVTISKPYYISVLPFTYYHGNSLQCRFMLDQIIIPSAGYSTSSWDKKTTTVQFGDWSGTNQRPLVTALTDSDKDGLVTKINTKTGLSFTIPTEAQLTLARGSMNFGSTWILSRDFYWEDLGTKAVTDPCAPEKGCTESYYMYPSRSCVTQTSRNYAQHREDSTGKPVSLRLCLVVDK